MTIFLETSDFRVPCRGDLWPNPLLTAWDRIGDDQSEVVEAWYASLDETLPSRSRISATPHS